MTDLYKNKKGDLDTQALYGASRKQIEKVATTLREDGKYTEESFKIVRNKSFKRLEVYEVDEDGEFMTGIFPLGDIEDLEYLAVGGALKYLRQSIKDQRKVKKVQVEVREANDEILS